MEGKKNTSIKDLKARLGVGKDNTNNPPLVPPPGEVPLVSPPTGEAPLILPPGAKESVSTEPGSSPPLVAPPGVHLPTPHTAKVEPEPSAPLQAKRIVVKGKIDEETASLAGLDKSSIVKKTLVILLPSLFFFYFGYLVGDLWFRSQVHTLQKKETDTLRKRVLEQSSAIEQLEKNILLVSSEKMSALSPEKATTHAASLQENIDKTTLFPEDGLFLPTTPFIDNGKKNTEQHYLGPLLDYVGLLASLEINAKIHNEFTRQSKDKLQVGFDKLRTRIKEILQDEEADLIIAKASQIPPRRKFTFASFAGYGLEILEGNKGKLVIIYQKNQEADPNGGSQPLTTGYAIYDAKFGETVPEEKADAPKEMGKTKVAEIDPASSRLFLLSQNTLPTQKYFIGFLNLVRKTQQIIAKKKRATSSLEKAFKTPAHGEESYSASPPLPEPDAEANPTPEEPEEDLPDPEMVD